MNKLDRLGADYFGCVEEIRERLGLLPVPVVIPAGAGEELEGVIDLIDRVFVVYDRESLGENFEKLPIPERHAALAEEHRRRLIEELANHVEFLSDLYLEERPIGGAELRRALREATIARRLTPVLAGAALKNIGVQLVLDAVVPLPALARSTCPRRRGTIPPRGRTRAARRVPTPRSRPTSSRSSRRPRPTSSTRASTRAGWSPAWRSATPGPGSGSGSAGS